MDDHNQAAKLSSFQFTSPHVSEFNFKINKEYKSNNDQDSLPIAFNIKKGNVKTESDGASQQFVELTMTIGNENSPFTFYAVIGADFRWSRELDDETVQNLINKNAVSLLIGYLRPIISQFTVQAGVTPLNLPFIDLT